MFLHYAKKDRRVTEPFWKMQNKRAQSKGMQNQEKAELERDSLAGKEQKTARVTAQENIVTQIKPVVEGNQIILEENGVKGVLTVVEPTAPVFLVEEHTHFNHSGNPEEVYTIRWEVTGAESCFIMEKQ